MSLTGWITGTAELWRATAASGRYGIPQRLETVPVTDPTVVGRWDRERAGISADVVSLFVVCIPSSITNRPQADDRLHLAGSDYRIRHVLPWPVTNKEFWEVFIEDEGQTY